MELDQLVERVVRGESAEFTYPEGWTQDQIASFLYTFRARLIELGYNINVIHTPTSTEGTIKRCVDELLKEPKENWYNKPRHPLLDELRNCGDPNAAVIGSTIGQFRSRYALVYPVEAGLGHYIKMCKELKGCNSDLDRLIRRILECVEIEIEAASGRGVTGPLIEQRTRELKEAMGFTFNK